MIRRLARRSGVRALLGTVVGNGPGLVLPFAVTAVMGAGVLTDVYFFSLGLAIFGASLSSMVIEANALPIIRQAERGPGQLARTMRAVIRPAVAGVLGIYLVVVVVGTTAVSAADAWNAKEQGIVIQSAAILALMVGLVSANSVWSALAYSADRFFVPTVSQSLRSVVPIAALPIVSRSGDWVLWLSVAMVLGEVLRSILLRRSLRSELTSERAADNRIRSTTTASPGIWQAAGPHAIAVIVGNLIPVTGRVIAAGTAAGAVTLIDLGDKVFWVPMLGITSGLVLAQSAGWASAAATPLERSMIVASFWRVFRRAAYAGGAAAVLITIGAWSVETLLGDREVANVSLRDFALIIGILAFGLPGAAAAFAGARFLTAVRQTRALPAVSAASLGTAVVAGVAGAQVAGVFGVAVAATLARTVSALVYLTLCRRAARVYETSALPGDRCNS